MAGRARLKNRIASRNRLRQLESRLELGAWDFSRTFAEQWQGTGFKAQITAGSKAEALILKRCLDRIGRVTSELVISPPHEIEGADGVEPDQRDSRLAALGQKRVAGQSDDARADEIECETLPGHGIDAETSRTEDDDIGRRGHR